MNTSRLQAAAEGGESKPPSDGDDEGEELWGMAEFLERKAERERDEGIPPAAAEFLARGLPAGDVASLNAAIADEKKRIKQAEGKGQREENNESEGLPEFSTQAGEREGAAPATLAGAPRADGSAGLGLEGGIFPSDVSPSKGDTDITMRPARLDAGQPEVMVGFWQVRRVSTDRMQLFYAAHWPYNSL